LPQVAPVLSQHEQQEFKEVVSSRALNRGQGSQIRAGKPEARLAPLLPLLSRVPTNLDKRKESEEGERRAASKRLLTLRRQET